VYHEGIWDGGGRGSVELQLDLYLISALFGGEWLAICIGYLPPGESMWYPLNRQLHGPQEQSEISDGEKNVLPLPESHHNFLVSQPVA